MLRRLAIGAGICSAVLFVVIGLRYGLQLYGDGALFSYAVAAQDAWAFHWHNISGRATVYLFTMAPAEIFVALTGSPAAGVFVYGLLFFAYPLLGLIATYAADRSQGRVFFTYACFSTAALCPLVFGFPTEMWLARSLFWPALALAHYARPGVAGTALVFAAMLALVFTHEGAIVIAAAIVATLLLRGPRGRLFMRGLGVLAAALAIRLAVKLILPPGPYFEGVFERAALGFFDPAILMSGLVLILAGALAVYGVVFVVLERFTPGRAHIHAAAFVALALVAYWLSLDHSLHAANRYYMRTALFVATLILGLLASLYALRADGEFDLALLDRLESGVTTRAVAGAFMLVMLIHAVETAKFISAWIEYKAAVAALATGEASDPSLGDPRFVSSERIGADLNRLSWNSTTLYLSVILAKFAPARLVVDPTGNYFWLSCKTATASFNASRAVPAPARDLLRAYACLHR
ncbi:MAG TPA: hypothetical protein VGC38_03365 [Pseudolabrys sp.]